MQMKSFTHLPLWPKGGLFPLPQPCTQQFKLLHSLPSQDLQIPRHIFFSKLSRTNLSLPGKYPHCRPPYLCRPVRCCLYGWAPIVLPMRQRDACRQGLCLPIRLGSRHQPLWSPPCKDLQKPHSFPPQGLSMCHSLALECLLLSPSHPLLPASCPRNS